MSDMLHRRLLFPKVNVLCVPENMTGDRFLAYLHQLLGPCNNNNDGVVAFHGNGRSFVFHPTRLRSNITSPIDEKNSHAFLHSSRKEESYGR